MSRGMEPRVNVLSRSQRNEKKMKKEELPDECRDELKKKKHIQRDGLVIS